VKRALVLIEDAFSSLALLAMVILPLLEIIWRRAFGQGIPASGPIVQHLTLWVGFLGAAIAARDGKLLALATGTFIPPGIWRRAADILAAAFGACSALVLAYGGYQMADIERQAGTTIGAGIPSWAAQSVLPIAFLLIAVRLVWRVGLPPTAGVGDAVGAEPAPPGIGVGPELVPPGRINVGAELAPPGGLVPPGRVNVGAELAPPGGPTKVGPYTADGLTDVGPYVAKGPTEVGPYARIVDRVLASLGLFAGALFLYAPSILQGHSLWFGFIVVIAAAIVGTPLFAILGGTAALLFMHDGTTPATILIETYSLSVSPTLAAIPLFTLAGFLLAEGKASERLLRVFRAYFGWIPGGTAVVCAVLCSFFTVFTGGSGVTILALGGVLFPALLRDGYREKFSLGLLTASGSLGLLLPPALPLILYAVVAQVPIEDIFIGGILPGILLTSMVAAWGVREGIVSGAGRYPFQAAEAWRATWAAKWELAMPALVLVAMFSGLATAVEASALTAMYALVVQTVIHRDLTGRALLRAFSECVTVIGGVLIILGVAVGLTNYLVGAQVPAKLLDWAKGNITSRLMFLLVLNVFLLVVGWLMEIFAAIVVVVPLIVPLGAAFGIHPVHLGIIFIANLELGFLTPLVGLNIFLASYRFKRPVLEVCVAALPMMGILGLGVLVITYIPWLTTGLLTLLGR
jgi:tripartite ATP-independent transporter DctM subunit